MNLKSNMQNIQKVKFRLNAFWTRNKSKGLISDEEDDTFFFLIALWAKNNSQNIKTEFVSLQ